MGRHTPAFAVAAERYRRAGELDRAIGLCRDGLAEFPRMLSARVTLGCALVAIGQTEEGSEELQAVLREAPDNLAAIRALADLHRRVGDAAEETQSNPMEHTENVAQAAPAPPVVAEPVRETPASIAEADVPVFTVSRPGIAMAAEPTLTPSTDAMPVEIHVEEPAVSEWAGWGGDAVLSLPVAHDVLLNDDLALDAIDLPDSIDLALQQLALEGVAGVPEKPEASAMIETDEFKLDGGAPDQSPDEDEIDEFDTLQLVPTSPDAFAETDDWSAFDWNVSPSADAAETPSAQAVEHPRGRSLEELEHLLARIDARRGHQAVA